MSQPPQLAAAQHHAQALAATGDIAGARLTLQHALESGRAALGEDDPTVLATAHQLASVHQQADDPSAARRVLEEAFAAGQWKLGDADPLMLAISYDIGMVAEELGNRHEARRAFARVATVGPPVLGEDHWAVTQARAHLGEDPPTVRMELPPQTQAAPGQPLPRQQSAPPSTWQERLATQPTPAPHDRPTPQDRQDAPPLPDRAWQAPTPQDRQETPATQDRAWQETPALRDRAWQPQPVHPPVRQELAVRRDQHQPPQDHRQTPLVAPAPLVAAERPLSAYPMDSRRTTRGPAVFAAIAAAMAAVIAVVALVVVLANRGGGDEPDVPTLGGGRPPSDVRLRDSGTTVEVTWTDPTDGTVSFMVTGAHSDEPLAVLGRTGPGQTKLTLNGLNSRLDYCFAVVAVYAAGTFNTSPTTCTAREQAKPNPSATG